ncbi:acetyl esterase [Shewanella sp. GXUN23E]|uniref:acetyl esterase n=1 Tax=Shewanella sp. GXUN23E TaxID=3422498 RepID=UPI003D7EC199
MNKIDVLSRISDEMREALNANPPATTQTDESDPLRRMRANYNLDRQFWNQGGPQMQRTLNVSVPFGDQTIQTRIHYPSSDKPLPGIFYIHGGGFIVGNLDTHDRIMRLMAAESGCVVIGIDYSLSPEAKFPQAIEECVCVTRYFRQHASDYGLDPQQMAYAGDSAGAHLCLASFLWQRDKQMDVSFIKALLLYYGLYGLQDSRSRRLYGGCWDGLTREDLNYYEQMYLAAQDAAESPYYCLFNNDLSSHMPACFIAGSEFDPLLDDSKTLHSMLQANNLPSQYQVYEGTLHAFLHCSRIMPIAHKAIADGAKYFLHQLERA